MPAAYHEAGEDPDFVAGPLMAELDTLRRWLGLASMEIDEGDRVDAALTPGKAGELDHFIGGDVFERQAGFLPSGQAAADDAGVESL